MDSKEKSLSGQSFMPKGTINTETSFVDLGKKPKHHRKRNSVFSPPSTQSKILDPYFDESINIDPTPNASQLDHK